MLYTKYITYILSIFVKEVLKLNVAMVGVGAISGIYLKTSPKF